MTDATTATLSAANAGRWGRGSAGCAPTRGGRTGGRRDHRVHGQQGFTVRQLDLADQTSVTEFVDGWEGPLHILVNNAGVMALPELTRTARDGRCSSPRTSWATLR